MDGSNNCGAYHSVGQQMQVVVHELRRDITRGAVNDKINTCVLIVPYHITEYTQAASFELCGFATINPW